MNKMKLFNGNYNCLLLMEILTVNEIIYYYLLLIKIFVVNKTIYC